MKGKGTTDAIFIVRQMQEKFRAGLSNLWQMAGHNYFFLKLAGQYTNNILLGVAWEGVLLLSTEGGVSHNFFGLWNGKWHILVHSGSIFM